MVVVFNIFISEEKALLESPSAESKPTPGTQRP